KRSGSRRRNREIRNGGCVSVEGAASSGVGGREELEGCQIEALRRQCQGAEKRYRSARPLACSDYDCMTEQSVGVDSKQGLIAREASRPASRFPCELTRSW